jgi:putative transposase
MYIPGLPCHVIQRGNNRDATFFCAADYRLYLECLGEACARYGAELHAYVLMTNHTHLLMTPRTEAAISRVMQSLGRRYVQYINLSYQRTGTLWESRHKASVVDAEQYLLACYRYIELNPVRASMVEHPGDYPWSSFGHNAYGKAQPFMTEHALYQSLGHSVETRRQAYCALFSASVDKSEWHAIRSAATFGMPLGNDRFKEQIERALKRKLGYAQRGRPIKHVKPHSRVIES